MLLGMTYLFCVMGAAVAKREEPTGRNASHPSRVITTECLSLTLNLKYKLSVNPCQKLSPLYKNVLTLLVGLLL